MTTVTGSHALACTTRNPAMSPGRSHGRSPRMVPPPPDVGQVRRDGLPPAMPRKNVTKSADVLLPEPPPTHPPTPMSRRDRTVIAVLLVSTFVVILNETIMSVALPVLMADLEVDGERRAVADRRASCSRCRWSSRSPASSSGGSAPGRLFGAAMALFSAGTLIAALAPGFGGAAGRAGGAGERHRDHDAAADDHGDDARPAGPRGVMMGNISIVISVAPAIGPTVSGPGAQRAGLAVHVLARAADRARRARPGPAPACGRRRAARRADRRRCRSCCRRSASAGWCTG